MPNAITVKNLSRRFGTVTAVDKVDLEIPQGQVFGFLGPNGCGKSTLIRMLCGLLRPTEGQIEVLGLRIPAQVEALKHQTGYMTQTFSLYRDLSVKENLNFIADIYALDRQDKRHRVAELMERYWLSSIRNQISGSLSGGQRQRLLLAAAVIHRPRLLLLDEPTSAVDPQSRRDFWESLFELIEQGTTILLSTHFMDEAERCHKLAILDQGKKVVEGTPKQLMQNIDVHVVEVRTGEAAKAKNSLSSDTRIRGVTQLGLNLRVMIDRTLAQPETYVRQCLQRINCDATIALVNANLEDVFVVATGSHKVEQR